MTELEITRMQGEGGVTEPREKKREEFVMSPAEFIRGADSLMGALYERTIARWKQEAQLEAPARRAYEAFDARTGYCGVPWNELDMAMQADWIAVVVAVLDGDRR